MTLSSCRTAIILYLWWRHALPTLGMTSYVYTQTQDMSHFSIILEAQNSHTTTPLDPSASPGLAMGCLCRMTQAQCLKHGPSESFWGLWISKDGNVWGLRHFLWACYSLKVETLPPFRLWEFLGAHYAEHRARHGLPWAHRHPQWDICQPSKRGPPKLQKLWIF